jgi:hypothetical protein
MRGIVKAPVWDKGGQVVNILAFGTVSGDGITDDGDAINAVLAANPGRTVYFPRTGRTPGEVSYFSSKTLLLSGPGQKLQGENNGFIDGTIIQFSSGVTGINIPAGANGSCIQDLILGGQDPWEGNHYYTGILPAGYGGTNTADGIRVSANFAKLVNVACMYFGRHAFNLSNTLAGGTCNYLSLIDCYALNCRGYGLLVDGVNANNCSFINFNATSNQLGSIFENSSAGNSYFSPKLSGNHVDGAQGTPAPTVAITNITRNSNTVLVTLASVYTDGAGHALKVGQGITIAGVTDVSFNGTFIVASVAGTGVTYSQTASNANSTGGTLRMAHMADTWTRAGLPPIGGIRTSLLAANRSTFVNPFQASGQNPLANLTLPGNWIGPGCTVAGGILGDSIDEAQGVPFSVTSQVAGSSLAQLISMQLANDNTSLARFFKDSSRDPDEWVMQTAGAQPTNIRLQPSGGQVFLHMTDGQTLDPLVITDIDYNPVYAINAAGQIVVGTIAESQVINLESDLDLKAPLNSPALTGIPTAPTASPGTDTNQIATTGFVTAALGGGGGGTSVTNSDDTLTISPTAGNVDVSLNLAHANIWNGQQTFAQSTAGTVGMVIKMAPTPTANPLDVQPDGSTTPIFSVTPSGGLWATGVIISDMTVNPLTVASKIIPLSIAGADAVWEEGVFTSPNTGAGAALDNPIHFRRWKNSNSSIVVTEGMEFRWWNASASPQENQIEWYQQVDVTVAGPPAVTTTWRPFGWTFGEDSHHVDMGILADNLALSNKAGFNYWILSDDGAGNVNFDLFNAGTNFFNLVSQSAIVSPPQVRMDRASLGRGDCLTTFTLNSGTASNQDPEYRMARAGITKASLRLVGNNTGSSLQLFHSSIGVALQFTDPAVWGSSFATIAAPLSLATSADGNAFWAGALWWSSDSANIFKVRTPADQVQSVKTYQKVSAVLDFPSIAAQTSAELTISLTGAAIGDEVAIEPPAGLEANLGYNARVTSVNTITVRLLNISIDAIDPASGTWVARLNK